MSGKLSDQDHELMDAFLGDLFEDVRAAAISKEAFIDVLALTVTAIDIGEHAKAVRLFCDRRRTPRVCLNLVR